MFKRCINTCKKDTAYEKDTLTDLFVAPLGPALDVLCEHLGLVGVDPPAVPRDPQWRVARDERRHLLGQLTRPQSDVAHVVQDQVLRPPKTRFNV